MNMPTAKVVRPVAALVGVTQVVGPPGPRGPRGPAGSGEGGVNEEFVENAIETHVQAPEPHPSYDDMIDLTLLFENGLV